MAKTYYFRLGSSGDPRAFAGYSPSFLIFNNAGTAVTPPSITAVTGATGFYSFTYGTTTPIVFLIDGATTSLSNADRYVSGSIDPNDRADEYGNTLVAIGISNLALGTSNLAQGATVAAIASSLGFISPLIGSTTSSYGTNLADPVDLFGYMKRVLENLEGNQQFTKGSGSLAIYTRGSSQLLITKTIANSVSMVVKS